MSDYTQVLFLQTGISATPHVELLPSLQAPGTALLAQVKLAALCLVKVHRRRIGSHNRYMITKIRPKPSNMAAILLLESPVFSVGSVALQLQNPKTGMRVSSSKVAAMLQALSWHWISLLSTTYTTQHSIAQHSTAQLTAQQRCLGLRASQNQAAKCQ